MKYHYPFYHLGRHHWQLGSDYKGDLTKMELGLYSSHATQLFDVVWAHRRMKNGEIDKTLSSSDCIMIDYPQYPIPMYFRRRTDE